MEVAMNTSVHARHGAKMPAGMSPGASCSRKNVRIPRRSNGKEGSLAASATSRAWSIDVFNRTALPKLIKEEWHQIVPERPKPLHKGTVAHQARRWLRLRNTRAPQTISIGIFFQQETSQSAIPHAQNQSCPANEIV